MATGCSNALESVFGRLRLRETWWGAAKIRQLHSYKPTHALEHKSALGDLNTQVRIFKSECGHRFKILGADRRNLHLSPVQYTPKRPKIDVKTSLKEGSGLIPLISADGIGISSVLGRRQRNEDRYCVTTLNGLESALVLGVFDGHGGHTAAEFCSKTFPGVIEAKLSNPLLNLSSSSLSSKERTNVVKGALIEAFTDINDMLFHHVSRSSSHKTQMYSGTTATVCVLLAGRHLYTASVGDSRAVLCRVPSSSPPASSTPPSSSSLSPSSLSAVGRIKALTLDHSPDEESERMRVERCGASVVSNSIGQLLVNGRLSMTRSIGDFDLKKCGVTAEAEVTYTKLRHHTDTCIVLVTDGVTYSMSNEEIGAVVETCNTPGEAAHALTNESLQLRSDDNCTAVVVSLGAWSSTGKMAQSASPARTSSEPERIIIDYRTSIFGRSLRPND